MSRSGEIVLGWGDAERTFRLGIKEWEKVQEKCDAGPAEIHARLAPMFAAHAAGTSMAQILAGGLMGTWRVHDIREPLYRGLIGGGMDPTAAGKLIRDLVDERNLVESLVIAFQVVEAGILGAPDELLGEPKGEAEATAFPAESSGSPSSTAPEPPSA